MKKIYRKMPVILIAVFLLATSLTTPAHAQEIYLGDSIPEGTTLEQDVILFGSSVTIDGNINGNVFILANQAEVNGMVDGSIVLIAQNAVISGTVSGAVYAAALTIDLATHSELSRDLYAVTVSITSGMDSLIGRDLYAIGFDSGMNGQVGRNLHTTIGPIQLYNGLMTLLGFEELTLNLHIEVPPPTPPAGAGSGSLQLVSLRMVPLPAQKPVAPETGFDWRKWALDLARDFGLLLVLGLLALWLTIPTLRKAGEPLRAQPLRTFAIGLWMLVVAVNLLIFALLLTILVFGIGLGLNFLGLWFFSLLFWVVTYSILFTTVAALWFFIVYGAKILALYTITRWVVDHITPKQAFWVNALAFLVGLLLYVLLRSIPYVGWVFGLIVTSAGIGSAWLTWRQRPKNIEQSSPEPLKTTPSKKKTTENK